MVVKVVKPYDVLDDVRLTAKFMVDVSKHIIMKCIVICMFWATCCKSRTFLGTMVILLSCSFEVMLISVVTGTEIIM